MLFLALFLRLLQPGGRAAVIVPDGVLFGSSKAHRTLRTILVDEQKLDAIVSMPSGVFKPYAGVSTAILLFTKTNSGGTDHVWFYDMQADGYSLDDKRTPHSQDKSDLGRYPRSLAESKGRGGSASGRGRSRVSWYRRPRLPSNDYDLSINRYKEVEYEASRVRSADGDPGRRLSELEEDIAMGCEGSWRADAEMTEAPTRTSRQMLRHFVRGITFKPGDVVPVGSPSTRSLACAQRTCQSELDVISDVCSRIPESLRQATRDQYLPEQEHLKSVSKRDSAWHAWSGNAASVSLSYSGRPHSAGSISVLQRGDP